MDKYYIFVSIKNDSKEVFRAKFIIVSLGDKGKNEREQEA